MKQKIKIVIAVLALALALLAWAPWLNDQALHDKILQEKGRKDGTIVPESRITGSEEALQELREESQKQGITDGILICDYKVQWLPFGRYVASCEGGYFVTFWGQMLL